LNITLFLGAGASVQFGNPATKGFKEQLLEKNLLGDYFSLVLKPFPDIEHVLECIKEIQELNKKEHLTKFLYNDEFDFEVKSRLPSIKIESPSIRLFMNEGKTIHEQIMHNLFEIYRIREDQELSVRNFFNSLFSLIIKYTKQIHIGTTNYDLAVEEFCKSQGSGHSIVDGFEMVGKEITWKPEVFQKNDSPDFIKLYKIHGSLNWQSDRGILTRLPFMPEFRSADNRMSSVVIAPTLSPKEALEKEPFSTILSLYSEKLQKSDVCIVIGFSFRDGDISDHFRTFVQNGKQLIIISPDCHRDYLVNLCKEYGHVQDYGAIKEIADQHARSNGRNVKLIDLPCDEKNNEVVFRKIESFLPRT